MIKLYAQGRRGQDMYAFGLSEGNIQRMREGHPIHILGAEWDRPFDIMIFWGETEEKLQAMVQPLISEETRVMDFLTNKPRKS
jgi:hypothetical protein